MQGGCERWAANRNPSPWAGSSFRCVADYTAQAATARGQGQAAKAQAGPAAAAMRGVPHARHCVTPPRSAFLGSRLAAVARF